MESKSMSQAPSAFTLADWQQAYRDAQQPAELLRALCNELSSSDNAWICLASAAQLDAQLADLQALLENAGGDLGKLPLYGVPFAIKDNIDATGVAKLRAAGAILIGKTNLDQFATGLVGTRSPYGAVPNSFNPAYVSGGSSSGSASVVARGLVSFALDTDTAGSGRVPAGFNNIVGLKPSKGWLSNTGLVPACKTLDCISVFALPGTVPPKPGLTRVAADGAAIIVELWDIPQARFGEFVAEIPAPLGSGKERPENLAERICLQLKDDIVEFRLLPGDRFSEGEIAERVTASRTPVRQALYRLQREGYLRVYFRSGWRSCRSTLRISRSCTTCASSSNWRPCGVYANAPKTSTAMHWCNLSAPGWCNPSSVYRTVAQFRAWMGAFTANWWKPPATARWPTCTPR